MIEDKEFCVMFPQYSKTKIHRGPYMLRVEAQHWVDGVEADGFETAAFEVWERPFFPWVKSSD